MCGCPSVAAGRLVLLHVKQPLLLSKVLLKLVCPYPVTAWAAERRAATGSSAVQQQQALQLAAAPASSASQLTPTGLPGRCIHQQLRALCCTLSHTGAQAGHACGATNSCSCPLARSLAAAAMQRPQRPPGGVLAPGMMEGRRRQVGTKPRRHFDQDKPSTCGSSLAKAATGSAWTWACAPLAACPALGDVVQACSASQAPNRALQTMDTTEQQQGSDPLTAALTRLKARCCKH